MRIPILGSTYLTVRKYLPTYLYVYGDTVCVFPGKR